MTQVFQHNGVGLHWREDGSPIGHPILLLNSLGTDMRLWDGVMPSLLQFRVIRFDMRGHGLSDAPVGPYSLAGLTGDAEALLEHIGISKVSLIGVSLGGMVAQSLAARRPELVRNLVLSNTGLRMGTPQMWEARIKAVQTSGLAAIARSILGRWFAPAFLASPELDLWRNMLLRTPAAGYAACCAALAQADLTATSPSIACPTVVIGGAEDGASPPATVEAIARAIPGASYHDIPDVGHLPMVEAPARFSEIVTAALKETADV